MERSYTCLLNHLIRLEEHDLWNGEAQRLRSLEVNDQLEFHGLSTGRAAGFVPLKILFTKLAAR